MVALALIAADSAAANDVREVVPEFNAFIKMSDQARLFLLADVTRASPDDITNAEVGIHLDYTLRPIVRMRLRDANWERDRYLWVRVGYQRLGNLEGDAGAPAEKRWLAEATTRLELAREVWLVNRLRLDLRDIGGSDSRRYRYRVGAEKEFATSSGLAVVPYAQVEWFYDTRLDALSRRLFQGGVEVELSRRWRLEPYYAYEENTSPEAEDVGRIGLVLKYYH
jgi:hypothetical protein